MKINKLDQAQKAVDRFITKRKNKNEPLESFRDTEDFKQFTDKIAKGILKQTEWLTGILADIDYLTNEELTKSEFEAQLGQYLSNEMPRISEYVSSEKVYNYLYNAFNWSVVAQYARVGIIQKAASIDFQLTNPNYIAALKDQANYLLNQSSIDETTRKRMITFIAERRLDMTDINQLADEIVDEFEGVSETRAYIIANTEVNQAMSTAQDAFLRENGFKTKVWVPAGPSTCPICQGNADQGPIPLDQAFDSGDMTPPGHPNCECYEDAGDEIDLDSIPLWTGGGGNVLAMAQKEVADLKKSQDAKIKTVERSLMGELENSTKKQQIYFDKKFTSLVEKVSEFGEFAKKNPEEIKSILKTLSKPVNKTVIQEAAMPKELIDLLGILSQLVVMPKPISLSEYKPHDQVEGEEGGDPDYAGFVHPSGAWYIVQGSDDQQRYASGTEAYAEAWKIHEKLDYKMIDEAFNGKA